jgi:hypothetical protein
MAQLAVLDIYDLISKSADHLIFNLKLARNPTDTGFSIPFLLCYTGAPKEWNSSLEAL